MLLGGTEATVQREHLGGSGIVRVHAADGIHRVADLGFAGKEHENIAPLLAIQFAQRGDQAVDVVVGVLVVGAVANLDRVGAPRHLHNRGGCFGIFRPR